MIDVKNKVLSIDQMKHLEELGLDTSDAWLMWSCTEPNCLQEKAFLEVVIDKAIFEKYYYYIPAYTLQDILEKLPMEDLQRKGNLWTEFWTDNGWNMVYVTNNNGEYSTPYNEGGDFLESAYNMLCWCLENGYIKKKSKFKYCDRK